MADNIAVTAGSGTTVSTEEITTLNGLTVSAQHLQRVIIATRTADGVATDIAPAAPAAVGSYNRRTLTATTTAADIAVANTARTSFNFTNNDATIAVWVNEGANAVVGSAGVRLLAGGTYAADTKDRVSVITESGTVFCSGNEAN